MYLDREWVLNRHKIIEKGIEDEKPSESKDDSKFLSNIKKDETHKSKADIEADSDSKRDRCAFESVFVWSIHKSISCKSPHHQAI